MPQTESGNEDEDVWNYLVYRMLTRLEEEQPDWRSVTSTQFSKLPCIVDRYLLDQLDQNIRFPRYWYKYGEVGNREPLDSSLYIKEESEEFGGIEIRPAKEEIRFEVDPNLKADIDEAVDFVVASFANEESETLKEFQYQHFAPEVFIQEFESFRRELYDVAERFRKNTEATLSPREQSELTDALSDLSEHYPENRYQRMRSDFEKWVDLMDHLIQKGSIGSAEALLEEFWDTFSKVHLRMEHNNNPIENQMDRWQQENDVRLSKFRDHISQRTD